MLRYDLGQREFKAITVFWERCRQLELIDGLRVLELYPEDRGAMTAAAAG